MKTISVPHRSSWLARLQRATHHGDVPWSGLIILVSILILVLVLAIGWMLWQQSAEARAKIGWAFILPTPNATWDPISGVFQSWAFIYGTLITSLFAIILAVPIASDICERQELPVQRKSTFCIILNFAASRIHCLYH